MIVSSLDQNELGKMRLTRSKPPLALPLSVSREALLADGSDHEFRELVHDMLAFGALAQEVRNRLAALIGLSGTQYTTLIAIARLSEVNNGLGINQIAQHLHLSGAFVTIEVNSLVAAGLVTKIRSTEDRRRVVLSVTDEGKKLLVTLNRVQQPANDTLFSALTKSDFQSLRRIIARLAATGPAAIPLIDYLADSGDLGGRVTRSSLKR